MAYQHEVSFNQFNLHVYLHANTLSMKLSPPNKLARLQKARRDATAIRSVLRAVMNQKHDEQNQRQHLAGGKSGIGAAGPRNCQISPARQ
jgi:hypothetical protein